MYIIVLLGKKKTYWCRSMGLSFSHNGFKVCLPNQTYCTVNWRYMYLGLKPNSVNVCTYVNFTAKPFNVIVYSIRISFIGFCPCRTLPNSAFIVFFFFQESSWVTGCGFLPSLRRIAVCANMKLLRLQFNQLYKLFHFRRGGQSVRMFNTFRMSECGQIFPSCQMLVNF